MSLIEPFLRKYKELEQSLNPLSLSVLDFEATLSQEDTEALRVCRILRNYAVHHVDGNVFISVSAEQCAFIDRMIVVAKSRYQSLKDFTVRLKPVIYDFDTMESVMSRLVSTGRSWLPVVSNDDKRFLGIISCESFLRTLQSSVTGKPRSVFSSVFAPSLSSLKSDMKKHDVHVCSIDKPAVSFNNIPAIVVLRDCAYAGVIDWNK